MADPGDEGGAASAKEIFGEALERPRDVRAAWLAGACRGRPELRAQVETLLEAWDRAELFMASPTQEPEPAATGAGEGPGSTIGVYKLLQTIGEGGMGIVYMAEQERPVRRKVALKIIKLGMDTKQVIGRFEAERQALAMMDHPNIARVLDAGATEAGRPYFVMELVKGVSINEYCDKNKLTTQQRLELFVLVCHAVQHAHQKGIIHRDLKPSNVLVTLHDGTPVPKVIDFGIAKATHQRLTERTVFTEFRSFIGTPEYMSPEQAELSGLDIDTRSDIYSLGVLLYELLVGTTPFDGQTLRSAAFDEMQRIIREEEPQKPSTRLSVMGETATTVAGQRSLDTSGLVRALRGDLDWIVMKALEKDRTRRYESASELAADIGRHLHHEPVLACPPSLVYKLRKFVHRNRGAVVSAGVIVLLLVGGILGTTWGMIAASRQEALALDQEALALERLGQASASAEAARSASQQEEQQRRLAEQAKLEADRQRVEAESQREEARQQAALAESESERARAVTSFLVDTLALADPGVALTPDITVRQMLDRAAAEVGDAFAEQPLSEATLSATIGQAYYSLGELELAQPHLRRAVNLWDRYGEHDPWELYTTLWHLTSSVFVSGSREIQAVGQRVALLGMQLLGQDQTQLVMALGNLFEGYMGGDLQRGDRAFEAVVRQAEASLEPGDRRWRIVADDLFACGYASWYFRNNKTSADVLDAAMRIYRRELPETHPQVALTIEMLVRILNENGEFERAEALVRESIEIRKRMLPPGHYYLANAEALLGQCLVGQQRYAEAEPMLLASLADLQRSHSDEDLVRGALVDLYEAWGRDDRAREQREALARSLLTAPAAPELAALRLVFGPELDELLGALEDLQAFGERLQDQGTSSADLERELARIVDRLLPLRRELVPDEAPLAALIARELINWLDVWERGTPSHEELRAALIDEARSILASWEDELPGDLGWATYLLGDQKVREGDPERAELLMREGLQLVERGFGRSAWTTATVMLGIAQLLVDQDRLTEAEPWAVQAHAIFVEQVGVRSWDTFRAAEVIDDLFAALGRSREVRATIASHVEALRRVAEDPPINREQMRAYADFLLTCSPTDLRDPATALSLAQFGQAYGGRYRAADLETLARALFETGDARGAAARQEDALKILDPLDQGRPAWLERLELYRAAAGD